MDEWLTRIEADDSATTLAAKVLADKPAAASDACWVAGKKVTDQNVCRAAFPYFSDARLVAGGPLTDDVLKCRLRPLDRSAYDTSFTDAQWVTLQRTFADGVCDFTEAGVRQEPNQTWSTYDRPGGTPMGPAPASH
jgi:hypothetical protein